MKKSVSLVKGFFCAFMLTGLFVTNSVAVSAEAGTEKVHQQELKVEYPTGDLSDAWKDNTVETIEISKEEFDKLPGARSNRVTLNSYRTDDYYYNMLNDTDKKVYEAYLTASKKNLDPVESGQSIDLETQAVLVYKGNQELGDINWSAISPAIKFDHPEQLESIVYGASVLTSTQTSSNGSKTYAYYFVFRKPSDSDYTGSDLAQMESELQTACNSFYNGLSLSGSEFDKELAIHDALIEAVEYNHDAADNNRGHDVAHTAYGAFVNNSPVCDGYSKAFKMLLNKAGIECHVVAGLGGGGGHAWNIVKIGGDYYEVDATWDDQTSADDSKYKVLLLHDYFNQTTADFESHLFDVPGWVANTTKHIRNENYLGYLTPAIANGTEYSYKNVKKVYTVSFDGVVDGANGFRKNGRTYEGKIIEMPSSVWATGYEFDAWYTDKTGGTKVDENTVLSGDTTLYAHWIGKKVTVTLRPQNGQTNTTKEVTFGDTYGELPNNLTRTGYIFAGWYKDTTYKTRITEETKVDSTYNHSIYAKWVAGEFTTTFDANGGTVQTESIKKTAGEYLGGFETPERYGYTFAGWYDAKEGGSRVYSISSVVEDRTLYAHWTPIRSRVVFYNNDGYSSYRSGYVNYSQTYESAFTSVGSISRTGYNLIGWFTEPEGGIQITADTVVDQVEERNLYAHWEEATVRVYFHADGSDRELQWVDVKYGQTYGDAIDALAYEPVKEHATFDGWSTSSSIFSKVTRSNTVTAEKHFYAHFVDDTFTLYLSANGGKFSGGSVSKSDQATYGTEMSLSDYATPTRDGYTFKGWSMVVGSAETVTSVTLTRDTTVYAVWEKKTYTLTLRGNGGSFSDGSSTKNISTYYSDDVNLDQYEAPTRNGYTFKGWGVSATDTTVINAVTVSGNVTVYAIWTKNTYTLKLSGNGGKFSNGSQTKEVSASYGDGISLGQYETPTKDRYTFKGWSTSSTGTSAVSSVTVSGNTTVYAIWEKIPESSGDNNQSGNSGSQGGSSQSTQGDNNQSGNAGSQGGSSQPTQGDNNQPAQPENKQPAAVTPAQPANDATFANAPVDATITDGGKDIQLSSTGEASVIDNGDMNVSSVTIGDTVTYEGITYNITEIKDNAYRNRKKLKSFTVGANIERIGSNAFNGCKSLKKITIKANNLKTVSKGSFKGIKKGAKITIICKDKKTFNKVTKMLKKAGAKKAKFKFKKG
ncbi:MAG: InlB B-repeat-containing protein [Butyrivibrio sp.]|nr:InlB B-repeat-containing protein [Butyrivibrio sp.]